MKQASRNESVVSLFFPCLNTYRALLLRIWHCTTEKSKHRLPMYVYICICNEIVIATVFLYYKS